MTTLVAWEICNWANIEYWYFWRNSYPNNMILGLKTKIKKTIKKEKGAMSSSSNSKRVLFHCKNYIFRNLDFRWHMMVGWKIVAISDIWSSGQLLIKFMYISFIFLISVTVCLLGQSQPNSPSAQCNEKTAAFFLFFSFFNAICITYAALKMLIFGSWFWWKINTQIVQIT